MANRKRPQDRTVNQAHMPRKNGPCKKSEDGFHHATVTIREINHVMSKSHWRARFTPSGLSYREEVECKYCGKYGAGTYSNNMLTPDYLATIMKSGTQPTCYNSLDKVNDQMKSKS